MLILMSEVRLSVREASETRGVANPFALARVTGLNYAICYRLWHRQTTQISLPTLAKVCDALSCEPGDVLVRLSSKRVGKRGK